MIHFQCNAIVIGTYEAIFDCSVRHTTQINSIPIQYPTENIDIINHYMIGIVNRQCPVGRINDSDIRNRKISPIGQSTAIGFYHLITGSISVTCMRQLGSGQDSPSCNRHVATGYGNFSVNDRPLVYIQGFSFFQCNPFQIMFSRSIILHACRQVIRIRSVRIRLIR